MDMKVSSDTMDNFRSARQEGCNVEGVELSVHVLTTGFWPTQSSAGCSLPAEIQLRTELHQLGLICLWEHAYEWLLCDSPHTDLALEA